jgi:hypothetical protein
MSDGTSFWYVYGVVPATLGIANAPAGLDESSLDSLGDGELAAVVSRLDRVQYSADAVERGTADMEWLAPRAVAHDRVLTWASDRGPVVPFPMFSLFSSDDAVRQMLREQAPQLRAALTRATAGREYALRVYRLDAELVTVAAEHSPRLAELQRAADAASPGQRYLLERKVETERKSELRAIGARVGREVLDALRPLAEDAFESRISPRATSGSADNPLVLDAAFLIAPPRLEEFQRTLTELLKRHAGRGFRFDFTGPWPPYHFVQASETRPDGT